MPKGDKYTKLKEYLKKSKQEVIKLSFNDIENIIEDKLPESSYTHAQAWWSNNADHSQAISWLEAGYKTEFVSDTYKLNTIVFVRQ